MIEEQQTKVVTFRRRRALFWDQVYGTAPWPETTAPADPRAKQRQIDVQSEVTDAN